MEKLEIGMRVNHVDYGKGTIINILNGDFDVEFDKFMNGHQGFCEKGKEGYCWNFTPRHLKNEAITILEDSFTKEDLQEFDIIELRDGDRYMLIADGFINLVDGEHIFDLDDFLKDLKYYYPASGDSCDIVKVERFNITTLKDVFIREKEIEEMTWAEVFKELGREIKIKEAK